MNHDTHELVLGLSTPAARRPARMWRRLRETALKVTDTLALWHFRAESRRELERMDDRLLRDAGIDRSEAYKPFWKA